MPTRRSLKDSSSEMPQEGKTVSARPSAKGKRVASVHAAAPVEEPDQKPAPEGGELASAVCGPQETTAAEAIPLVETDPAAAPEEESEKDEVEKKAPSKRPSARGKRASAAVSAPVPNAPDASEKEEAEKGAPSRRSVEKKKRSPLRIFLAVLGGIVAALIVVTVAFLVDRWVLHDDAADLQGTWYVYGTSVEVPIDQKTIGISSDTSYKYTIDAQAKTVSYSIGNLSGTSHYRFSSDRSMVALIEDGKQVFTATLIDDVSWWFTSIGDAFSGKTVLPGPQNSSTVLLSRTPTLPAPEVVEEADEPADEEAEGSEDSEESEEE